MRRNKLKFHNNGTKCSIVFSDGKESDIYTSKATILNFITELVLKKEISFVSFSRKVEKILYTKNLPAYETKEEYKPEKVFNEESAFLKLKSFTR
jgi:hypothetical protein